MPPRQKRNSIPDVRHHRIGGVGWVDRIGLGQGKNQILRPHLRRRPPGSADSISGSVGSTVPEPGSACLLFHDSLSDSRAGLGQRRHIAAGRCLWRERPITSVSGTASSGVNAEICIGRHGDGVCRVKVQCPGILPVPGRAGCTRGASGSTDLLTAVAPFCIGFRRYDKFHRTLNTNLLGEKQRRNLKGHIRRIGRCRIRFHCDNRFQLGLRLALRYRGQCCRSRLKSSCGVRVRLPSGDEGLPRESMAAPGALVPRRFSVNKNHRLIHRRRGSSGDA